MIRIVTDSSCDLPALLAADLGIEIVPLTVRFGDEEFVDRLDLTPAEFWLRCTAASVLPETAAPAPGAFEAAYRRLAADGATAIVAVCLSGGLSATIQSASLAATGVAGDLPVHVVDSRSVSMGLGMTAVAAAQAARNGATAAEVTALAEDLARRTRVWAALDTLENLKKGGRIGGAKALLASVLSIKPIIEVRNGVVEEAGRQRTRSKAWSALVQHIAGLGPLDAAAVMHASVPDVDRLVAELRAVLDPGVAERLVVGEIGAVIGAHGGIGTVGVVAQVTRR